jgi:hypothetical protein
VPGWYDSGTGKIATPIGRGALYLAIPLGLLLYVRHRIGANTWRRPHRFVIVVYVLSVWHTLLYGTNVWYGEWPRTVLWPLQLPVAVLLLLLLLRPARPAERLHAPGARGRHPVGPGGAGAGPGRRRVRTGAPWCRHPRDGRMAGDKGDGGTRKPVRIRRGPATVIGERIPTRPPPRRAGRPGRASTREPGDSRGRLLDEPPGRISPERGTAPHARSADRTND